MSQQCLQAISRRRQEDFGQEPEEESSFNHPVFTRIFDDTRLRDDDDVATVPTTPFSCRLWFRRTIDEKIFDVNKKWTLLSFSKKCAQNEILNDRALWRFNFGKIELKDGTLQCNDANLSYDKHSWSQPRISQKIEVVKASLYLT